MIYARSKPKKEWGKDLESFRGDLGGKEAKINRERSRRNEEKLRKSLIQKLHKSRQIETCRELLRIKKAFFSYRSAIQYLSKGVQGKES